MASSILDGATTLALVATLLPLQLFSIALRLLPGNPSRRPDRDVSALRSLLRLVTVAILLAAVFALSGSPPSSPAMTSELDELRTKTAHLEFIMEENISFLNIKRLDLEEKEKIIQVMEKKIQILQDELYQIKESVSESLHTEERVHHLENQVQLLQDKLQSSSYNVMILESSLNDAMRKAEIAASKVKKMDSVVREQWIEIRQLEQAFQLSKIMASKVERRNLRKGYNAKKIVSNSLITKVSRVFKGISGDNFLEASEHPDSFFLGASFTKFFTSLPYKLLKRTILLPQDCHYELQIFIKLLMGMSRFTAPFASEFIAFILASAIMFISIMALGSSIHYACITFCS